MAAVLERVRALAHLLSQAPDPLTLADTLVDAALAGAGTATLLGLLDGQVADTGKAARTLAYAGVLDTDGQPSPLAAVCFGQAGALLAEQRRTGYRLVLTVPPFLDAALPPMIAELGADVRPIDTVRAMRETAAAADMRLQIAAPFLHTGFIRLMAPNVGLVLARGGQVQLLTRALTFAAPQVSSANIDAVELLRKVADGKPGTLSVHSWEDTGLGIHFKVVLGHRPAGGPVAYIGSSNPTPGGTLAHAEAGVLAHGPAVIFLSQWLDATAQVLTGST